MLSYLDTPFDLNDENLASAYDEVPFWSFPFGNLLFDNIKLRRGITALDIGFGNGFPLLELCGRLGSTSTVFGIDIWRAAATRAKFKAEVLGIDNLVFVEGDAAAMDFDDEMFDLIISNVGLNNFDDPSAVLAECYRTAKRGAQIAFTTNPVGHMSEFYQLFAQTLTELKLGDCEEKLAAHQNHRLSCATINKMLGQVGFTTTANVEDAFSWRFVDGTAFFNHHMIKRGFVPGWQALIPADHQEPFFRKLEQNINDRAKQQGEFKVTIPMLYIEAVRPS